MYKLIEMKEKVREFNYKWQDKDKSEPLMWSQVVLVEERNSAGMIWMNFN